jgi:hypothetical protein
MLLLEHTAATKGTRKDEAGRPSYRTLDRVVHGIVGREMRLRHSAVENCVERSARRRADATVRASFILAQLTSLGKGVWVNRFGIGGVITTFASFEADDSVSMKEVDA